MWEFFAECLPVSRPYKTVWQFVSEGGVEKKHVEQLRRAAAAVVCVVQIFLLLLCQLRGGKFSIALVAAPSLGVFAHPSTCVDPPQVCPETLMTIVRQPENIPLHPSHFRAHACEGTQADL